MYKILIADDEVIERKVLHKRLLRDFPEENIEVFEAANGREVLELYEKERPQILILDIEMPGVSGLKAAEMIRENDRKANIIFLTAFDEFAYAKRAITIHALDYLLKPCADGELQAAVLEAMHLLDASDTRVGGGQQAGAGENVTEGHSAGFMPDDSNGIQRDSRAAGEHLAGAAASSVTYMRGETAPQAGLLETEMHDYISRHYMDNLSVQEISSHFGYSEAYFCKLFKQYFGRSFITYLTDYRIRKAEELMREERLSIAEIGTAVGYPDPNYFAKVFRRITGLSPKDYRSRHL